MSSYNPCCQHHGCRPPSSDADNAQQRAQLRGWVQPAESRAAAAAALLALIRAGSRHKNVQAPAPADTRVAAAGAGAAITAAAAAAAAAHPRAECPVQRKWVKRRDAAAAAACCRGRGRKHGCRRAPVFMRTARRAARARPGGARGRDAAPCAVGHRWHVRAGQRLAPARALAAGLRALAARSPVGKVSTRAPAILLSKPVCKPVCASSLSTCCTACQRRSEHHPVAMPGLGICQGGSTGQVTQLGPAYLSPSAPRLRGAAASAGAAAAGARATASRRSAAVPNTGGASPATARAMPRLVRAALLATARLLPCTPAPASPHTRMSAGTLEAHRHQPHSWNKAYKAMKCTRAISQCKSLEALAAVVHCWRAHKPRLLHETLQGRRVVHGLPATHRLSLPCGGAATEIPPCQRSAQTDPSEILTEGRKRWRTAGPSEWPVSGGSWCSACSTSIGRAASARAAAECARAATKCGGPCRCPAEGAALAVRRPRSARGLLALLQTPAGQGAAAAAAAGAVAKPGWTLAQQRPPGDGSMKRCGWQR